MKKQAKAWLASARDDLEVKDMRDDRAKLEFTAL